jgi:hypothetical protein
MIRPLAYGAVFALALGCGSKQTPDPVIGTSTSEGDPTEPYDMDSRLAQDGGGSEAAPAPDAAPLPPALVTFVVTNTHTEELVFNLDHGWGGSVLAYTGTPPKAVSILPFPKHCTSACDAPPEGLCPVCPEPEKLVDIRTAQKLERVAAGATLEIPWDGQVHTYQKTRDAKNKKCQCYTKGPVPAGDYTINICGLRLTQEAKKSSQLQCVQAQQTLPVSDPVRIEVSFPAPPPPPTTKKKK